MLQLNVCNVGRGNCTKGDLLRNGGVVPEDNNKLKDAASVGSIGSPRPCRPLHAVALGPQRRLSAADGGGPGTRLVRRHPEAATCAADDFHPRPGQGLHTDEHLTQLGLVASGRAARAIQYLRRWSFDRVRQTARLARPTRAQRDRVQRALLEGYLRERHGRVRRAFLRLLQRRHPLRLRHREDPARGGTTFVRAQHNNGHWPEDQRQNEPLRRHPVVSTQ